MKIGYPCINTSIPREASSTFRLASYSEDRLIEVVNSNLNHLEKILKYNVKHNLLFFRISSDLVPFASHPICEFDWQDYFAKKFKTLGKYIKKERIRISMHPDQFVLLNSPQSIIVTNSVRDLTYHSSILDLMGLDSTAKIQIHVGGVYGDKISAIKTFEKNYNVLLSQSIKKRLVIENDDRLYNVNDCLRIHGNTDVPILFDSFHHKCNDGGDSVGIVKAFEMCCDTWKKMDGVPLADYSCQEFGHRRGKHSFTIDLEDFRKFILETRELCYDLMLEIKDKQISALKALELLNCINR